MTVAVAGGTGFVGGGIAAELVRAAGTASSSCPAAARPLAARCPTASRCGHADVADRRRPGRGAGGRRRPGHRPAFKNSPMEAPSRGQTFMEVDAAGTEHLVAAAREAGRAAASSTSRAPARPRTPNGTGSGRSGGPRRRSAAAASTWTIIRPTWIYGPRDVSLNRFIGFARQLPVVPDDQLRRAAAGAGLHRRRRRASRPTALVEPAAASARCFELGGPETLPMREVIAPRPACRRDSPPDHPRAGAADPAGGAAADAPAVAAADAGCGRLHQPAGDGGPGAAARADAAAPDPARRGAGQLSRPGLTVPTCLPSTVCNASPRSCMTAVAADTLRALPSRPRRARFALPLERRPRRCCTACSSWSCSSLAGPGPDGQVADRLQLPDLRPGHADADPAQRTLFELPIGPAVAAFFAMSAIAHFAVASRRGAGTSAAWRATRTRPLDRVRLSARA